MSRAEQSPQTCRSKHTHKHKFSLTHTHTHTNNLGPSSSAAALQNSKGLQIEVPFLSGRRQRLYFSWVALNIYLNRGRLSRAGPNRASQQSRGEVMCVCGNLNFHTPSQLHLFCCFILSERIIISECSSCRCRKPLSEAPGGGAAPSEGQSGGGSPPAAACEVCCVGCVRVGGVVFEKENTPGLIRRPL